MAALIQLKKQSILECKFCKSCAKGDNLHNLPLVLKIWEGEFQSKNDHGKGIILRLSLHGGNKHCTN